MKSVKRNIFIGFATCFTFISLANAASYQWSFNLDTGESVYSSSHAKADSEQTAYVRIDDGNIDEGADKIWFRVRRTSDDLPMTETKWASTPGIRFTLDYTERKGVAGEKYRLKMQQDSMGANHAHATGYWTP